MVGWLVGWLIGRLVGWLVGWLAGWMAWWLVGSFGSVSLFGLVRFGLVSLVGWSIGWSGSWYYGRLLRSCEGLVVGLFWAIFFFSTWSIRLYFPPFPPLGLTALWWNGQCMLAVTRQCIQAMSAVVTDIPGYYHVSLHELTNHMCDQHKRLCWTHILVLAPLHIVTINVACMQLSMIWDRQSVTALAVCGHARMILQEQHHGQEGKGSLWHMSSHPHVHVSMCPHVRLVQNKVSQQNCLVKV